MTEYSKEFLIWWKGSRYCQVKTEDQYDRSVAWSAWQEAIKSTQLSEYDQKIDDALRELQAYVTMGAVDDPMIKQMAIDFKVKFEDLKKALWS